MSQWTPEIQQQTIALYRNMPGAKMPAMKDGNYMWGDVEGTPEWEFCEEIVFTIGRAISQALREQKIIP